MFLSIRAPAWGAICQKRQQSATIAFQSAHLHKVRYKQRVRRRDRRGFNPRTYTRCAPGGVLEHPGVLVSIRAPTQGAILHFNITAVVGLVSIRAPTQGAIEPFPKLRPLVSVSIRAPTQGAMATQSKIRPIRGLTPPHRSQNRRILGNPSPQWHPCARPLREKRHRFYDHLWIALERFIGSSHRRLCCGCKFSVVRAKRPCFGLPRRPTKRRIRPY